MLSALQNVARAGVAAQVPRTVVAPVAIMAVRHYAAAATATHKRPATSYALFVAERRNSYAAKHPNLKNTEVLQGLARLWRSLPDGEKITYTEQYEKNKEKYDRMMAERTPEQKKHDRKVKALSKDKNAPKRPLSSYIFFCNQMRPNLDPTAPMTEHAKTLGARWKSMSDDDKKKYEDMAKNDKKRYEKEMAAYERSKH